MVDRIRGRVNRRLDLCERCQAARKRPESLFCSDACRDAYAAGCPETIVCFLCDDGVGSLAEAEAAGWRGVEQDVEGPSWNYLGQCPACAAEEDADDA